MKPLKGIKVLEFSQALSGPFCGMMLADMGAEVIKLERPPLGDPARYNAPGIKGITPTYSERNRGKKSIYMDLGDQKQREFFLKMAETADIVLENFKPGTLEKFGCDYEALKKINPGIIVTSISGFGQTGPMRRRAAYDVSIQAESGLISITGTKAGELVSVGYSVTDTIAGLTAFGATLSALYSRIATGEGQYVDISMQDSVIATMEVPFGGYALTGKVAGPLGIAHPLAAPFSIFDTSDGGKILICVNSEAQWARMCEIMEKPEWTADPRFLNSSMRKANEEELMREMTPLIQKWTEEDLVSALEEKGIAYGRVNTVDKVMNSEQFQARSMLCRVNYPDTDTSVNVINSAVTMSGFKKESEYTAYPVGYHTISECSEYMGEEKAHEIYDELLQKYAADVKKAQEKAGVV